ncbi:hypothetical protein [Helicobacter ailurogastricus]|uniref:hypothetical protein n=1 Tax=Helicobacter ailurogastricus TaxID=1578720 RepID=UPI0022C7F630|nr:hypothetical protein [Helicobacter ailurogastricus]GLH58640.1 hypothetical protein NHP214376_14350 [Helicobacter ailurogastricus]GLH60092.1 hypothetical protein NHP214377_13640 [Helicobacter ailurogastricus]GMB90800.1 hypothetical protein NHP190002_15270 [Helicobacter ailurogastricus]
MRLHPLVCTFSLLSVSALYAENSGAYGEVGFQYSNMTKATQQSQQQPAQPLQPQSNPLTAVQPTNGGISPTISNNTIPNMPNQ